MLTAKDCKHYLINEKGWALTKYDSEMDWYYWKTGSGRSCLRLEHMMSGEAMYNIVMDMRIDSFNHWLKTQR